MQIAYITRPDGPVVAVRAAADRPWTPARELVEGCDGIGAVLTRRAELAALLPDDPPVVDGTVVSCLDPGATVVAAGLNFHSHVAELGAHVPTEPFCFPKLAGSVAPPDSELPLPRSLSEEVDYEVELAVVVGATLRDATVDEALAAIGGYAVANDVSARNYQVVPNGWVDWVKAKGLDGFLPLGPVVTTADDVPDLGARVLRCWVNGEQRQEAPVSDMIFSPAELVAYVSRGVTLRPGDVILGGTPGGVGHSRTPPVYLAKGDEVVCAIDGLGSIRTVMA